MKLKICVFGMCAVLSACGGKSDRNQKAQEAVFPAELKLTNLESQSFTNIRQTETGSKYYYLGSFASADLPASISGLSTESEIGTLSVVFEEETYAPRYEGLVLPVDSRRVDETKIHVYLIKDPSKANQVTFAVRSNAEIDLKNKAESIDVRSSPREYCSDVHVGFDQVEDGISVLPQEVKCDASDTCWVTFHVDGTSYYYPRAILLHPNTLLPMSCTGKQINYDVVETKVNKSEAKTAMIQMNEALSRVTKKIQFDL